MPGISLHSRTRPAHLLDLAYVECLFQRNVSTSLMFLTDSQIPDVQFFLFLVQMFHIRFLPGLALPASLQVLLSLPDVSQVSQSPDLPSVPLSPSRNAIHGTVHMHLHQDPLLRSVPSIPMQCVVPSEYSHTVSFQVLPGSLHNVLHHLSGTPANDRKHQYFPMKIASFPVILVLKIAKVHIHLAQYWQYIWVLLSEYGRNNLYWSESSYNLLHQFH